MDTKAQTISVSVGERVAALKVFNSFKGGSIQIMKALLDDVKQLPVTDEEWKEANLVKTPTDEEVAAMPPAGRAVVQQQWKWDETVKKEITLQPETVDYLKAVVKEKSEAGLITFEDVALVSLDEKLK